VHPVPAHQIDSREIDGKLIVLVEVEPRADKPYSLFRKPPQFFARRGATSFHATREEIITFATWSQIRSPYV
jgi:predicted HTH transcriptional regulator